MPGNDCPEPEIFFLLKFSDLRNDRYLAIAWPASFYFFERKLPFFQTSAYCLVHSFNKFVSGHGRYRRKYLYSGLRLSFSFKVYLIFSGAGRFPEAFQNLQGQPCWCREFQHLSDLGFHKIRQLSGSRAQASGITKFTLGAKVAPGRPMFSMFLFICPGKAIPVGSLIIVSDL